LVFLAVFFVGFNEIAYQVTDEFTGGIVASSIGKPRSAFANM
jgi:hypothetical protein